MRWEKTLASKRLYDTIVMDISVLQNLYSKREAARWGYSSQFFA
jgi:hypothetical protein